MLRTPIQGDTGPDERDERFAVALALLLPETSEDSCYDGSVTKACIKNAATGFYRCCGYPHTKELESWPPFFYSQLVRHLLPTIREIWMQCYTTT